MKTRIYIVIAAILALAVPQVASAQTYAQPYAGGGFWSPGYGQYHHASTAAEGYLNGWSNVIQARGMYNYYSSLAAINGQEARRQATENAVRRTAAYFERKQIHDSYMDAHRRPPMTEEQRQRVSAALATPRLSPSEFDSMSRTIIWPAVLSQEAYDDARMIIDELFSVQRPTNSGLGTENYREIRALVEEMQYRLKEERSAGRLDANEWAVGHKFLQSLRKEAQIEAPAQRLAANN